MKHFKTEEWIDFVNQVNSQKQRESMEKHLGTGCKQCRENLTLWQRVHIAATMESAYQPPAAEVRIAKAAFSAHRPAHQTAKVGGLIQLLFDSFSQPMLAGARSSGLGTRQMLYRADPYQIDIQIEAKPEGNRLMVTGQLLDISSPGVVGRDVRVTLSNNRGNIVHVLTNQFGEFRGDIDNSGDLELSFPSQSEKSIVISLRNALGGVAGNQA